MSKYLILIVSFMFVTFLHGKTKETSKLLNSVHTINWSQFENQTLVSESFLLAAKVNANAARYAILWAAETFPTDQSGQHFVLDNKNDENAIRPATSAALGLAVAYRTDLSALHGKLDKEMVINTAKKLIRGVVRIHKTSGGNWGHHWQSSLWAAQVGRAGWLLWDQLDTLTQSQILLMLIEEANRHIRTDYQVPYWNGKGGDSKAEENSWESTVLQQAIVMLPKHPNIQKWKAIASELQISAYSFEVDMLDTTRKLDGKTPKQWLQGFNVREDGIIINHNLVHNDYMVSIAHLQMAGAIIFSLGDEPAPQTYDFNFDKIYKTLVTKTFSSPPWQAPGGTMYIPGKPEQYYPQGTDWSPLRFACFYGMDMMADVLGHDKTLTHKAAHWLKLRGDKMFEMQSRFEDGRMYTDQEFTSYPNREQGVFWMMSDALMLQWLADRDAISGKANWLDDKAAQSR